MQSETISEWWKLCEKLEFEQAVLLIIGYDPGNFWHGKYGSNPPAGYKAVSTALQHAIESKDVVGELVPDEEADFDRIHPAKSTVQTVSLKAWLTSKGMAQGFLFGGNNTGTPDYINPDHPRYSPKLAAAVQVWQAMQDPNLLGKKSPKTAMELWLATNYKRLGLFHEQDDASKSKSFKAGEPNKTAIEEVAKVANWHTKGGATPTSRATLPTVTPYPTHPPAPHSENPPDCDSEEIPF